MESLKAALFTQQVGLEEQVQVNQRHLIDKILARYSAENTIFRELLQNSNGNIYCTLTYANVKTRSDAGATDVEIHFKTSDVAKPPPPRSLTSVFFTPKSTPNIGSVTYKNNGRPFSGDDWNRLRKIAEGNPDEQKIGFFGVGFYSLFSICEEPFVTSGSECMGFFWKGDQLFTKKGALPPQEASAWTTFFLSLRDPIETPNVADFGKFLATSLAFTKNLKKVEVFFDDQRVLLLTKKAGESRPLTFPRHYNLYSPNHIFELRTCTVSKIQLDVNALLDYDKQLYKKEYTTTDQTIFMRTATASCSVKLNAQLAKEMERTTKKKAPPTTDIHLQFSNYDEYESSSTARGKSLIFDDLIPGPKEQGRIFIGFPTHQTTGAAMQLAAHLIPTVERESIDFVDRTLNIWNQDLLTMGGLLARIVYEDEMAAIGALYKELDLDETSENWIVSKASHSMSCFTFKPSTPHPIVSRIHGTYFFKSSANPISVISTKGVLPGTSVRLPNDSMKPFIKEVPMLPALVMQNCRDLVAELEKNGILRALSLDDVFVELSSRVFGFEDVVVLLKWWLLFRRTNAVGSHEMTKLFTLLTIADPATPSERPKRAIDFKYFVNPQVIQPGVPVPSSVLPLDVTKGFSKNELHEIFGFVTELTIVEWAEYVIALPEFSSNPFFVEKIMGVVSRQFASLSSDSRIRMVALLCKRPCIVTTQGIKVPVDTYFKNVTLFTDLPIVSFENMRPFTEAFLKALGVRDYVDLQVIFSRLQDLKWDSDHVQLVKYLSSVQAKLTDVEIGRLRLTPVFPKEDQPTLNGTPDAKDASFRKVRYKAGDLYAPSETLRSLGLPLIDWPGKQKWRSTSDEAKLLHTLGLRSVIPWAELVMLIATAGPDKRSSFLAYFIDNWKVTYASTYIPSQVSTPFLPSTEPEKLYIPSEVFSDPSAAILGFPILHPELRPNAEKFGVRPHPLPNTLVAALKNSPPSLKDAPLVFSYFAGRQADFTAADWKALHSIKFIPIFAPVRDGAKSNETIWVDASMVYFGTSEESEYKKFFNYIDFGNSGNAFLRACGVKDQPTPQEVAQHVTRAPGPFLEQMGFQKYLQLLRTIAANYHVLKLNSALITEMRKSAFLLGVRSTAQPNGDVDEESEKLQYQLARASDVLLVDDTVLNQLFSPLGAPMEELLEGMYQDLGSQWLSKMVGETTTYQGSPIPSKRAADLQTLIHERALLLLYNGQQIRSGKEIIDKAEIVLKTLEAFEVSQILIERKFSGVSKTQKSTACLGYDKSKRRYVLFITSGVELDYFDVAQAIGKIIFKQCRLNDSLLLSTLLSTSLVNLKRKGFPVDRILNLQAGKLKAAIAHQELQKGNSSNSDLGAEASEGPSADQRPAAAPSPQVASTMAQITQMFPDIDSSYLRKLVESETDQENAVAKISNDLLDSDYPKSQTATEKPLPRAPTTASAGSKTGSGVVPPGAWPESGKPSPANNSLQSTTSGADMLGSLSRFADSVTKGWLPTSWTGSPSPTATGGQRLPDILPGVATSSNEISPDYTQQLKSQLSRSVKSVRSTDEKAIQASIPQEKPLPLQRSAVSCAPILDSDLERREIVSGVSFYVDRKSDMKDSDISRDALMRFIGVLKFIAGVFDLNENAINLFWDRTGSVVAFNRNRTLFFNLRYYIGLHYRGNVDDADTYYYWFMTMSHELAHNFVEEHNSQHEFYFSSYAELHLKELNARMKELNVSK